MEEPWQGNKRDIRLGFWEKGWGVLDRAVDRRKQISGDLYNGWEQKMACKDTRNL